jgi:hypothetical protein
LLPTEAKERPRDGEGETERRDFFLERSGRGGVGSHVRTDVGKWMPVERIKMPKRGVNWAFLKINYKN